MIDYNYLYTNKLLFKLASFLTLIAFSLTSVCDSTVLAEERPLEARSSKLEARSKGKSNKRRSFYLQPRASSLDIFKTLKISSKLGDIIETHQGQNEKLIIHIQDVHCHFEAQSNTAGIIQDLWKKHADHGLKVIGLEAASGPVDTSLLTSFPDLKIKKAMAEYLMKQGRISGAEYLSIIQDKPLPLQGVENMLNYFEHLVQFRQGLDIKDKALPILDFIQKKIESLRPQIYSTEALTLLQKEKDYLEGTLQLSEYGEFLEKQLEARSWRLEDKSELEARGSRLEAKAEKQDVKLGVDIVGARFIEPANGSDPSTWLGSDKSDPYKNFSLMRQVSQIEKQIDFEKVEKERLKLLEVLSKKWVKEEMLELMTKSLYYRLEKMDAWEYYSYLKKMIQGNRPSSIIHHRKNGRRGKREEGRTKGYPNLTKYIKMTELFHEIKSDALLKECEKISEKVQDKLLRTKEEKALRQIEKDFIILRNFFELEMKKSEFQYYVENQERVTAKGIVEGIEKLSIVHSPQSAEKNKNNFKPSTMDYRLWTMDDITFLDFHLKNIAAFYKYSSKREEAMVKNTLQQMDQKKSPIAILYTGGFHTDGMMERLKKEGASYVVIAPRITEFKLKTPYLSIIKNEPTKLEKMLMDLRKKENSSIAALPTEVSREQITGEVGPSATPEVSALAETTATQIETRRVSTGLVMRAVNVLEGAQDGKLQEDWLRACGHPDISRFTVDFVHERDELVVTILERSKPISRFCISTASLSQNLEAQIAFVEERMGDGYSEEPSKSTPSAMKKYSGEDVDVAAFHQRYKGDTPSIPPEQLERIRTNVIRAWGDLSREGLKALRELGLTRDGVIEQFRRIDNRTEIKIGKANYAVNIHWREGPYELKGVKLPAFGYLERNKGRSNVRGTIHLYLSSEYSEEGFLHEVLEHIILRTSSRPEISGKGLRANSKEAKTAASRRHTLSAVYEGILGDYWQPSRRAVGQIQGMTPQERRQFKGRYYSEVAPGIHSKFPRAQFPHSNEWVSHYASEVNSFAGRFEDFLKNWGEEGAKRESFLDQCEALKIAPGKVISWLNTALKLKGNKTQYSAFYLFDALERNYSPLIPEYAALLDKVFEESVSLRVKYHVFDLLWNAALQDSENRKELLKIISEILDRRDEDYILVAFEALSSLLSYRNYSYFSRKLEFFSELLALQDVEISIYVFRALSKLPQNAMSNSEETPALFKSLLEIPDKQRQKEGFSLLSQLLKDSRFSIEEWPSFVTLIKLLLEEKNARLLHLLASWLDALVKIEDIDQSHYARKWLRQVLLQAPKPEDLFPERTWQRGRSLSALEEAACYWMEQEFGMKEEDILALLNDPEIKKICPVFFFSALETMDIVDKGGVVSPSISEQEAKDILRRVLQTKADPRMVPRIMKYFLQDPRKREASEVVFRGVDLSLYLSTDVEREIRNEELPDYQATLLESAVLYHDLILKRREALKESLGSYEAADQAMVVVANLTNGWFPLAALTEGRVDGNTYILGTNIQVIQTKIGSSEIENVGFTGYFDDVFSGEEKSKIGRARQVIVVDVSLESMESPADFPNKFHYPSAFVGYLCYLMKSRGIAIPQSWNARFANSLGLLRRQGTEVKFWYPRAWYPVEHSAPLMGEFKGPYEPVPQGYDISNETGEPRLGTQGQEWVFCHAALPRKTNIDRLHLGEYALQGKRWDDKGKEREGTLVAQGSNGGWKLQTSWRLTNGLRGLWNDFIEGETFKGIFRDHSSFPRQATSTKNQIHLLALDLDGTLTSPEKTPLTSATVEKLVNILWSHSDLSLMIATMQGMDELRRTVIQPLEERMRGWTQHQRDYILNRIGLFPCGSAQGYLWEEENWAKKYDKAEEQEIDFGRLAQVLGDSVHNRGASLEAYGSGGRLVEELKQNPESEIRAMAEKLEVSEDGWHIVPKGITKAVGRDFMMSKRGIVPGQVMAMGNNPRMSLDGDPWMQPLGGCFREVHSPDETLAVLDRFFPAPNSGDTVLNSATSEAGMAPFMSLVLDWFGIPREKQAGYEQVGYLAAFIIIVASIVASTPLLMQGFLGMMGVAGVFILIHPLSYFVIRIFEKLLGHPLMPQGPPLKGMVPPPAVLSEAGSPSANWPVGPTAGGGMVLGATKAALANTISLIPAYLLYFYMNSYPALAIVALLFYIPASRYHHEMNLEYLKNEGLENYDATAARRFSTMASLFSSTLNSSKLTLTFKSFLISLTSDSIRELLSSSFAVLASIRAVLTSIRALLSRSWRTDASNLAVLSSSLLILPSILVNLSLVSYRKLSRLLESASNLFSDFSDSSSTLLRRATTFSPTALNWLRISSIRTALYRCISSVGRDFGDFFSFMEKMLELAQNSVKGFRIINNISLRFSRASLKPILKSLLLLPFAVKLIEMVLDYGTASAAEMGHVAVAEAAGTGVAGFVGVMLVLLVAFTIYVNARVGDAWFGIGQWQTTLQLQQSSTQLSLRQPWLQSPFGQISIPTIKKVNADTLKAMLIHTDILRKNSLAKMAAIITFVMSMIVFASNSLRALVKTLISLIAHTIIQLRMTVQGNSFTRSKSTQTSSLAFLTRIQQVEPEFLAPPEVNPLLNELIEQVMKEDVDDALKKRMKRAILRMGLSSITFGQFMDELEGIVRVRSRGETEPIDEKAIPEMVAGEAETLFLFAANVLKVGSVPFEVIEGLVRAYQSGLDYDGIAIFDLRVITLDDLVARLSHGFILPKGGDATLSLRVQEGMKESRLSLEIASLSLAMTNAKRGILTVNADGGLLVSGKAIEIFPREQSQLKALYQVVGNQTEPLSIDLSRVHPQRVDQILKSIFSNQEALREGLSIEGFSDRALVRAQLVENMIRLDVQSEERRFERVNQQYLSGSFREADQSESLGVVWSRGNFNIKISRSKSGKAFLVQANSPEFRRVYREMILRLKQNSKNVAALSVPLPYKEGTLSTEELHHLEEAILRALWGDPLTFDQAQKQLKEDIQIKFYFKNDPSLRRGKLAEKITGEMRERGVKKVNVLVRKREGKVYGISEDVYIVARGDAKAIAILASRWAHQGSPGLEAMLADINRIDPDALTRLGQERSVAATARSLEENFEKERLTKVLAQTAM